MARRLGERERYGMIAERVGRCDAVAVRQSLRLGRRGWPPKFFAADPAVRGARQIALLTTPQFLGEMRTRHGRISHFPFQLEFSCLSVGHGHAAMRPSA